MNDLQVIQALIGRDPEVTGQFFFRDCRPLFVAVIRRIFDYAVDYDEFVSELYLYLMENDAARLLQFRGRSRIYQWLKIDTPARIREDAVKVTVSANGTKKMSAGKKVLIAGVTFLSMMALSPAMMLLGAGYSWLAALWMASIVSGIVLSELFDYE